MLKYNRQQLILDALEREASVSIQSLILELKVPRLTIQRDLVELEEKGELLRVHGGAIKPGGSVDALPPPRDVRAGIASQIKKKLCKKATTLIKEGDTIFIDASTTASYIPEFLSNQKINAITSSIETFSKLTKQEQINAILTGGQYNRETQNLIGSFTAEALAKFSFSYAFLSADGFDFEKGSLDIDVFDSAVKKAAIASSEKIILLLDATKFKNPRGLLTCPIKMVHAIVTTKDAAENIPKSFKGSVLVV